MTPFEIEAEIRKRLPDATVTLDPPDNAARLWYLYVERGSLHYVVESRNNCPFGVTDMNDDPGFGDTSADEWHTTAEAAIERVVGIFTAAAAASPRAVSI